MKIKVLGLLFASFITASALASGPGFGPIPLNTDPNCVTNPRDPFEPRSRMQKGPDAGACINATLRRSAKFISGDTAALFFPARTGTIVVANVSHKSKFWVARIPLYKITKMVLQSEHFPMLKKANALNIDHTQIRFDFSEPVELLSQGGERVRERAALNHIIFSVENIGPRGEVFDFIQGMKGHFNMAYRLVSLEDKYNWMIVKNKNTVDQREFLLDNKQAAAVLFEGIRRGTQFGSTRSYHSLKRNCASELVNMFSTIFGTPEFATSFYSNLLDSNLQSVGMLSTEDMPTLNDEYQRLN